jgi:hypothetical protein
LEQIGRILYLVRLLLGWGHEETFLRSLASFATGKWENIQVEEMEREREREKEREKERERERETWITCDECWLLVSFSLVLGGGLVNSSSLIGASAPSRDGRMGSRDLAFPHT